MISDRNEKKVARKAIMDRIALQRRFLYLKRIFKVGHMDFEFAIWQMIYLFISPKKVFRNFSYHQETKRQWARDDPAFLVLFSGWLFVASIIFAVALELTFLEFVKLLIWVIFIDCIGFGLLVAGILSFVVNKYLRFPGGEKHNESVEFGYAFDVHLNAFFPLLIILHIIQLLYIPLAHVVPFIGRFFGNTLWLIAFIYYFYITFLGYSALPFLRGTVAILWPLIGVFIIYCISLFVPSLRFSDMIIDFYHHRVAG